MNGWLRRTNREASFARQRCHAKNRDPYSRQETFILKIVN